MATILASVGEKKTEITPVAQPDEEGRHQRAAEAPEPAEDHHHEGQEQRVQPHEVVGLLDRDDEGPGHGRQAGP